MPEALYTTDKKGDLVVEYSAEQIIVLTEDKVKLRLLEHFNRLSNRENWKAPLGIVLTLVAALSTATFERSIIGIKPAVIEAIFWLSSVFTLLWLGKELKSFFAEKESIDDLIGVLKAETAKSKLSSKRKDGVSCS